jgi:Flp pilus assembly protein TadD
MKRLDEAVHELQTFAGENPMLDLVPSARQILGDAYAVQGKWNQATNEYRLALSMIPNNPATTHKMVNAMNNQGLALADAGKYAEAVAVFRRAVQWEPQNWSARHNLAAALLDSRDAAAAEAEARKAVEANPTDAGSRDLLGRALAIQGKFDEAIAQLREALKVAPGDAQIEEDLQRVIAASKPSKLETGK